MKKIRLPLFGLGCLLAPLLSPAQTLFNNASSVVAGSDNTGDALYQPGTEVLASTPGLGVSLAPGGSYEHVGQFYVAANGIWNRTQANGQASIGTDYFGYAPTGVGANTAYLGKGIMGASALNGGKGIGRPSFGHLQLNSVGEFPVEGGMLVTHSLVFNANGPGRANQITTPNCLGPASAQQAVVFFPTASIVGADHQNYINGYASVTDVTQVFTLPLGDAAALPFGLHPLNILSATTGTVTARYVHHLDLPTDQLGEGVGSVSPVGSWPISAPAGTRVSVSLPDLKLSASEGSTLRLVGWTGSAWIALNNEATAGSCAGEGCLLTGTVGAGISCLAIGSTSPSVFKGVESAELGLTVWPNPTQSTLNLSVSSGKNIRQAQALDLQGRPVLTPPKGSMSLNVSGLPAGTYLIEVLTTQGQTFRKHFVKQD